jgi:serine-type D-Ala-D-Ala carboxypeptidase (penicillin-binding protein 5/6)
VTGAHPIGRFRAAATALGLVFLLLASVPAGARAETLTAKAVVVMDAITGQVVEEESGEVEIPPASLAKMMTLYLIYTAVAGGQAKWDDPVWISEKAWRTGGSKMFVKEGDKIPLIDLAHGIAIVSGNDACIAAAEHLSGSEEAFVQWMNEEAAKLGLTHTHFGSATGLPAPDQRTTAGDMALLARHLIGDYPQSIELLSTKSYTHEGITQPNRNGLLWRDLGVDGVKTGHTEDAGFHLVATAARDDDRFIVAVMGADSEHAREMIAQRYLMEAFRKFVTVRPLNPEVPVAQLVVWKGQSNTLDAVPATTGALTLARGEQDKVSVQPEVGEVVAPVHKGDAVGKVKVLKGDQVVEEVDLVAANDIGPAGFFKRLWHTIVLAFRHFLDVLF